MNEYRYYLDRKSKKFRCPNCGDKSFTKYLDKVTEDYLPDQYGKCDHANRCDYHLNPYKDGYNRDVKEERPRIVWLDGEKIYFQFEYHAPLVEAIKATKGRKFDSDKKVWYFEQPDLSPEMDRVVSQFGFSVINVKPPKPVFLPENILQRTLKDYDRNNFIQNLLKQQIHPLPASDVEAITGEYYLGTTSSKTNASIDGAITFPFIDITGNIRAIQVKNFDADNHTTSTNFIHSILQKHYQDTGAEYPDWLSDYCEQDKKISCLFGEHLLSKYPNNPVALVEAPKTAIIGSLYFGLPSNTKNLLWLAVYNKDSFTKDKVSVLKGRQVLVFPDLGAFDSWSRKANDWDLGFRVSDILEKSATDEEKANGYDLADYLVKNDWRWFRGDSEKLQQYPSNWDQPLNYTPDELRYRFINWLTNLEAAVITGNRKLSSSILEEIDKAGYTENVPDDLMNQYAPTVAKLINQNN